jgi:hypothetical protein
MRKNLLIMCWKCKLLSHICYVLYTYRMLKAPLCWKTRWRLHNHSVLVDPSYINYVLNTVFLATTAYWYEVAHYTVSWQDILEDSLEKGWPWQNNLFLITSLHYYSSPSLSRPLSISCKELCSIANSSRNVTTVTACLTPCRTVTYSRSHTETTAWCLFTVGSIPTQSHLLPSIRCLLDYFLRWN